MNYEAALNFVKTVSAHPALINDVDFKGYCDAFVAALNEPASTNFLPLPEEVKDTSNAVYINVSGTCSSNPGRGGYAAILSYHHKTKELSGSLDKATPNQMELLAITAALEALKTPSDVVISTTSNYVAKNYKNLDSWRRNKYRTKGNRPVVLSAEWQKLSMLITEKCTALTIQTNVGFDNEACKHCAEAARTAASAINA